MRLHLLGIPHTITSERYSHCAFTGKVQKFPRMMANEPGFEVIHYGTAGAEVECETVDLLTQDEFRRLLGHDESDPARFVGTDANSGTPLYREFNARLSVALADRYQQGDLILLPFGTAHSAAFTPALRARHPRIMNSIVESGIGYPNLCADADLRVFESNAWMHWHQGNNNRNGRHYEWVIPNYFDEGAWDFEPSPDSDRVVFLGRINKIKGMDNVLEIARRRPDLRFEICGQGDPAPWLTEPNITYRPPLVGRERSSYLGNARAALVPSMFTEPFGGVAVEAMMCGTPVLTTTFGAFTETVTDGETGYRCHTLGDFLAALDLVVGLDRKAISERARARYGLIPVAKQYARVFRQIADLSTEGWYTPRSDLGPVRITGNQSAWRRAQAAERTYHVGVPENRPYERMKREHYVRMMGIERHAYAGKKVIDVAGGPESFLLECPGVAGTVLDPLFFEEADEARYVDAGFSRLVIPAEEWVAADTKHDEAWCYNGLQHVQDVEAVLAKMREMAPVVRLWEWCNIPTDVMHLHVLTAGIFRSSFSKAGWRAATEYSGHWDYNNGQGPQEIYSAVFFQS